MTITQANCPACGAPISFKIGSSVVVVCSFCRSVVARSDRAFEDLGKVAEIAETGSPLQVGLQGVHHGVAFELTGRAQLGHEAGGRWDEWYAAFRDGRWGWLSEAQGRFYLTFQELWPGQASLPSFDALELGHPVAAIPAPTPLVVAEKAIAHQLAAEGEIPYRLTPGETYPYADLSGQGATFATLDYSQSPPLLFVGKEVALSDLGIAATAATPERAVHHTAATQLSCPKCGGPLELRAPDVTERITCPNCSSLLDVDQGQLRYFKTLEPARYQPFIQVGATGDFEGGKLTVLGFMVRSVEVEGERYFWEEYLLYNPAVGFRWLVRSDGQWSFVQPVPPGEVSEGPNIATLRGKVFNLSQDATARVEYVTGEFYWKVSVGDEVRAIDYVNSPETLSIELSTVVPPQVYESMREKAIGWSFDTRGRGERSSGEINCSLGRYVSESEVETSFGSQGLSQPIAGAIAGATAGTPHDAFTHSGIYKYWAIFMAILVVMGFFFLATGPHRRVFQNTYNFQPLPNADGTQVAFSEPFNLQASKNIKITGSSDVANTWIYAEGDLISQETGLVQPFSLPIEYYNGVEDGESWSEGSRTQTVHLSAVPEGNYILRLEAQWEKWQQPSPTLSVTVEQGDPRFLHLLLALLLVSSVPLFVAVWHRVKSRR